MVRTHETALVKLAGTQHGLVTNAQCHERGLDDDAIMRLRRSGRWEPTLPGVVRSLAAPVTWEQQLMAACLWGGPLAVASHRSGARLWGLDGEWGDVVEVTVQYAMTNERLDGPVVVHRTRRLEDRDRTLVGAFPATRVDRTLVDLAAILDQEPLEVAVESAFRRQLTSPVRLARRVEALSGRRGLRGLRQLLRIRQPEAAHSRWEARLLRLIRGSGLPEPVRQHRVWDGERWRRIDLAYPELKIGIEYDSYRWHSGRQAWEQDHTRNAGLTALGWRMLLFAMDDVDAHPDRTVHLIARLIDVCVSDRV